MISGNSLVSSSPLATYTKSGEGNSDTTRVFAPKDLDALTRAAWSHRAQGKALGRRRVSINQKMAAASVPQSCRFSRMRLPQQA